MIPAEGDGYPPGDARYRVSADLPDDWTCPGMFRSAKDAVSWFAKTPAAPSGVLMAAMMEGLQPPRWSPTLREICSIPSMRDLPMVNHRAACARQWGSAPFEGGYWLGILIAPWFMNLVLLPRPEPDRS